MEMQVLIEELRELVRQPYDAGAITLFRIKLAEARTEALLEYYEARGKALMPKDAQWTDLDRKTMLDGFTAEKEKDHQMLVALEEIVSDYLKTQGLGTQVPSQKDLSLGN